MIPDLSYFCDELLSSVTGIAGMITVFLLTLALSTMASSFCRGGGGGVSDFLNYSPALASYILAEKRENLLARIGEWSQNLSGNTDEPIYLVTVSWNWLHKF